MGAWFAWLCVWFALARVRWWSFNHPFSVSARTDSKNCRSSTMTDMFKNQVQNNARRYGCTTPTSEAEQLLGACQSDASQHNHVRPSTKNVEQVGTARFTVECVHRRLQTLALKMCFARMYRQNNALLDVTKKKNALWESDSNFCDFLP